VHNVDVIQKTITDIADIDQVTAKSWLNILETLGIIFYLHPAMPALQFTRVFSVIDKPPKKGNLIKEIECKGIENVTAFFFLCS